MNTFRLPLLMLLLLLAVTCSQQDRILGPTPGGSAGAPNVGSGDPTVAGPPRRSSRTQARRSRASFRTMAATTSASFSPSPTPRQWPLSTVGLLGKTTRARSRTPRAERHSPAPRIPPSSRRSVVFLPTHLCHAVMGHQTGPGECFLSA